MAQVETISNDENVPASPKNATSTPKSTTNGHGAANEHHHEDGVADSPNVSNGHHDSKARSEYSATDLKPERFHLDRSTSTAQSLHRMIDSWRMQDSRSVGELNKTTIEGWFSDDQRLAATEQRTEDFWNMYADLVYEARQTYPSALLCPVNMPRMKAIMAEAVARRDKTVAIRAYWKFCKAMAKAMDQMVQTMTLLQKDYLLLVYERLLIEEEPHMARKLMCLMGYVPKVVSVTPMEPKAKSAGDRWRDNHQALLAGMVEGHTDEEFWTSFVKYMNQSETNTTSNTSPVQKGLTGIAREAISRKDKALAIKAYDSFHDIEATQIDKEFPVPEPVAAERSSSSNAQGLGVPLLIEFPSNEAVASTSPSPPNWQEIEGWHVTSGREIAELEAAKSDAEFWRIYNEILDTSKEFFDRIAPSLDMDFLAVAGAKRAIKKRSRAAAVAAFIRLTAIANEMIDQTFNSMSEQEQAHIREYYPMLQRQHTEKGLTIEHLTLGD